MKETTCKVCEDEIEYALCNDCFVEKVEEWHSGIKLSMEKMYGDKNCLVCGKRTGVCSDCLVHDAFGQIAQKSRDLAKLFVSQFGIYDEIIIKY